MTDETIILVRLATGQEVIGRVIEENNEYINFDMPVHIIMTPISLDLMPFSLYTDSTEIQKKFIIFKSSNIHDRILQLYSNFCNQTKEEEKEEEETTAIEENLIASNVPESIIEEFMSNTKPTVLH